jgi:hypothetical protein
MEELFPTYQQIIDKMTSILKDGVAEPSAFSSVYSYTGEISKQHIAEITTKMESRLTEEGMSKTVLKRSFNIILEGLQNAYNHSKTADGKRFVALSVSKNKEGLDIVFLSLTDAERMQLVQDRVDILNEMDRQEIKTHYRTVMNEGTISAKGGAGLGLITMVMKSTGGMKLKLHAINNALSVMKTQLSV